MKTFFYRDYYAQTWYRNTFLVRRPTQIGRADAGDREWNNLHDSGCAFTCIAMIVGVDPARLASALSKQSFFYADADLPATMLTGVKGGLVWDANAPHAGMRKVTLPHFWHPHFNQRVNAVIRYKGCKSTRWHSTALRIVKKARQHGLHIVFGPYDHAHLIAGRCDRDFLVWDPDDEALSVEDNLAGNYRLKDIFEENPNEPIEFCFYALDTVLEATSG